MLEKMDQFLLNRIEKFCHRFQRLTGKTNLFLSLPVISAFVTIIFLKDFGDHKMSFLSLIVALGGITEMMMYHFKEKEKSAYDRISRGLFNPRKIEPFFIFLRKFSIIFFCLYFLLAEWLAVCGIFCLCLFFYLDSCDPLPPCRGKIREMIDAFFAPKPVPAPARAPER